MKEVLDRMLAIEAQAKQLMADAERNARQTVEHAQAEARRVVDDARQRGLADANALHAERVDAVRTQHDRELREAKQANQTLRELDPERCRRAVAHVLATILGEDDPAG